MHILWYLRFTVLRYSILFFEKKPRSVLLHNIVKRILYIYICSLEEHLELNTLDFVLLMFEHLLQVSACAFRVTVMLNLLVNKQHRIYETSLESSDLLLLNCVFIICDVCCDLVSFSYFISPLKVGDCNFPIHLLNLGYRCTTDKWENIMR